MNPLRTLAAAAAGANWRGVREVTMSSALGGEPQREMRVRVLVSQSGGPVLGPTTNPFYKTSNELPHQLLGCDGESSLTSLLATPVDSSVESVLLTLWRRSPLD